VAVKSSIFSDIARDKEDLTVTLLTLPLLIIMEEHVMNNTIKKKPFVRFSFTLTLFVFITIFICSAVPLAAPNDETMPTKDDLFPTPPYERDFDPGYVLVGFKEAYKGSFSNEEFSGLDVVEIKDLKLSLYESLIKLPNADELSQDVLNNLKNKAGIDYIIRLSKGTNESVWEAISILELYPNVAYATPRFILKPDEDHYEQDYELGYVLVGFKEPYKGFFSNEEFPGLDVVETRDLKLSLYESFISLPYVDELNQDVLNNLKNRAGIDYIIKLAKNTKESVLEAIHILEQHPNVAYAIPNYILRPAEEDVFELLITSDVNGTVVGISGHYKAGETIELFAAPSAGYRLSHWDSSSGGEFADVNNASTTFVVPSNNVVITPYFYLVGDIDGDGVVTMADAMIIFDYISGKRTLTPDQLLAADVDGDGVVTMADFLIVFDYLSGKRPEL